MKVVVNDQNETSLLGQKIGTSLKGGEVIELIGDVGAGKTTLTKSIAIGLGITEPVQSPTFTISNRYDARDDLELVHYDFYRLGDAGIMEAELQETIDLSHAVTVIEWGDIVTDVLPEDRLTLRIKPLSEWAREIEIEATGSSAERLLGVLS